MNLVLIPWFVMIFTNFENFYLKMIIFEYFLIEGMIAFFKVALTIFKLFSPILFKIKNFIYF